MSSGSSPVWLVATAFRLFTEEPVGHPRRDGECHHEREEHGRRGVDRNRPHVGTHQATDKRQRQQGRDDGKGGENGRVADFVDGENRCLFCARPFQLDVAVDVLHYHDGVVDENPDRKDEREEADPVQCVAEEVGGGEGQRKGHRDHHCHHGGLAPRKSDPHQENHGDGGGVKVFEQLIGLLVGRGPIVAGLEDLDVRGDHSSGEPVEHVVEVGNHVDGVGAGFLCHRDR